MSTSKNFAASIVIPKVLLAAISAEPERLRAYIDQEIDRVRNEYESFCFRRGWIVAKSVSVTASPVRLSPHCFTHAGKPKRAYPSREDALADVQRYGRPEEVHAYECSEHGWHLGGTLSRALRTQLRHARSYGSRV